MNDTHTSDEINEGRQESYKLDFLDDAVDIPSSNSSLNEEKINKKYV